MTMAIKTDNWKDFTVKNIFPTIVKPNVYHAKEIAEDQKGIPYVVRTKYNNGIKCLAKKPNKGKVNPANVISFGAENATFFFQPSEWISGRDMYYVDTSGIDKYACLFLVSCFQTITSKYPYNYGLFPELLKQEHIKLPVDKLGKPDWIFMSQYMHGIETKVYKSLNDLLRINTKTHLCDDTDWDEYVVGDLFEKLNLHKKKAFRKAFDISLEKSEEFSLPLINAKNDNNGIMYYGREADFESAEMTLDIVCDGAASAGNVFAQPQKTGVLYNAYLIKPKYVISKYALFYLASVMHAAVKKNFSYDDKAVWDKVKKIKVKLPTLNNNPDWKYMDNYMKSIEMTMHNKAEALSLAAGRNLFHLDEDNS